MADFTTSNLIVSVAPGRFETQVLTSSTIVVTFLRDMEQSTFSDATVALEVVGTVLRVPVTLSYANKQLTVTPTGGLLPNTSYRFTLVGDVDPTTDVLTNHISGILDIVGNGMIGSFQIEFKTGSVGVPVKTVLQLPLDQSAVASQPTFSWQLTAADYFEIQVSKSNSFEVIYWPNTLDSIPQITNSVITPARPFDYNTEYWWRVRGVMNPAVPGPWSVPFNLFYGDPTVGTVTPFDAPIGFPSGPTPVSVISAFPAPGSSNLATPPDSIIVKLAGAVNLGQLSAASLWIDGEPVDGNWDAASFAPVFSPSLNGSMFGSGGIDYPGPVDSLQEIAVAGTFLGTPTGTAGSIFTAVAPGTAAITTISLTLPASGAYFKDNNSFTVTLDIAELATPLTWTFTSKWHPIFSSVKSVRNWTDFILPEVTDDTILYKIRHNSLYALMIQVFPPTQLDGQSWVYQPPVSFNLNDPPFFVRKYVELKTAYDFLMTKFWQLIGGAGRTTLGDFTVDRELVSLKENLKLAIDELKLQILPFEDKLHGHTNRGYARGQWAERGGGAFGGPNSTSGIHGDRHNDNSYIWPRSSRRQF